LAAIALLLRPLNCRPISSFLSLDVSEASTASPLSFLLRVPSRPGGSLVIPILPKVPLPASVHDPPPTPKVRLTVTGLFYSFFPSNLLCWRATDSEHPFDRSSGPPFVGPNQLCFSNAVSPPLTVLFPPR